MIVKKTLTLRAIYEFTGHHLLWLTAWMCLITSISYFTSWKLIRIPLLPLSLIGTAVAFYVGFKNNQSYDRVWEARQIWGAIVNNSRKLGVMIRNFSSKVFEGDVDTAFRKEIVYRHIAYLYQLREQLLRPTQWEHVSLKSLIGKYNRRRRDRFLDLYRTELAEIANSHYISKEEQLDMEMFNNKATQLLNKQTQQIQVLYKRKEINSVQQKLIQEILNSFYDEQGKAERIKNFPFPRIYASFSFVFVCIFVFLLPFGIVAEFGKMGSLFVWLSVPFGVIVGWIYVVMELIGDYSENPFSGLYNDIPMLSICRNIEIDLLQIVGEKNVPQPIQSKRNVLL